MQEAADRAGAQLGLLGLLLDIARHFLPSQRQRMFRHAAPQHAVFLERTKRAPQRVLEPIALVGEETVGSIAMADMTAVAKHAPAFELPQRAAALEHFG